MSVINTNVKAMMAQESMRTSNLKLSTTMERLATGLRINSAKDDAAGLAITNRMDAQSRGFAMAIKNANDAISMSQTAEGAYGQVEEMLQRMRELAVQSATGAVSDSDRESIQLEIDELKEEIDNVASTTHFNNIKLLDGSAREINIQSGANAGQFTNIGFDSAKTKDIGVGVRSSLSSHGGELATSQAALASGDLLLNGVLVGASLATDDNASSASGAASAIAKAAAINRVSDQSGVFAKVDQTVVYGNNSTMVGAGSTTGFVTINGVNTETFTTAADQETTRVMVVAAINRISDQTGVVATNTHDDDQGVVLTAADGRNITIAFDTVTANEVGLHDAGTYVGSYSLYTTDGSPVVVDSQVSGTIGNSGLALGSYEADTATFVTGIRASASAAPSSTTTGVLNGDTLVINDITIDAAIAAYDTASDTTAATSTRAASAIAVATSINAKTDLHGVTATASPNILRGTGFTAAAGTAIYLNGVTIDVSLDSNSNRDDVVTAINQESGRTGVVASNWGEGIQLVAEDGRNISIGSDAGAAGLGLTGVSMGAAGDDSDAVTHYSKVTLTSAKEFTVQSGSEGNANFDLLGFVRGTFGGSDNGLKIADIDLTTAQGSTEAIVAIDAAIENVSSYQARSGAFQNRLESAISVLSEANSNISAAKSRILDTDYATETTALAKAQIVQQAATAMLAQANQQSQSVLALLQ
jgi:flagellin